MDFMEMPDSDVGGEFLDSDFSIKEFIGEKGHLFGDPDKLYEEIVRLAEIEKTFIENYKNAKLNAKFDFSKIFELRNDVKSMLDLTKSTKLGLKNFENKYFEQMRLFEKLTTLKSRLSQLLDVLKLIRNSINVNEIAERSLTDYSIDEAILSINQFRKEFEKLDSPVLKNQFYSRLERFTCSVKHKIDERLQSLTFRFVPDIYSSLVKWYEALFPDDRRMFGVKVTNIFRISVSDAINDCIVRTNSPEIPLCTAFQKTWIIMNSFKQAYLWNLEHFVGGCPPNQAFEALSTTAIQTITLLLQSFGVFNSVDDFIVIVDLVSKFIKMCETFASFDEPTSLDHFVSDIYSWAEDTFVSLNEVKLEEFTHQLENEHWHNCPVACIHDPKKLVLIHELHVLINFILESNKNGVSHEPSFRFEDSKEISFLFGDNDGLESASILVEKTGYYHICNTGVNFLRTFGKYISFMEIFPSTSFQVITNVYQMLFVFIKIVLCTFMNSSLSYTESVNERISTLRHKLKTEDICPLVEFDSDSSKFKGYLVAIETIRCIASHLYMSHTLLLTSQIDKGSLIVDLYDSVSYLIEELNELICRSFGRTLIFDREHLISSITNKRTYESEQYLTQLTDYINSLIKDTRIAKDLIDGLKSELNLEEIEFTPLWDEFASFLCQTILDGFGRIKKCSNEKRGQMMFDFENLILSVNEIVEFDCFENYKDVVLDFIRAFYMSKQDIEAFIRDNKAYTNKQLSCLVSSMDHLGFVTKQKLQILINTESLNH